MPVFLVLLRMNSILLRSVLTHDCLVCARPIGESTSDVICDECAAACVPRHEPNRCRVCSISMPRFLTVCNRCRTAEYAFDTLLSVHRYSGRPAGLIHAYKFGRHRVLAPVIAGIMAEAWSAHDSCVPLPRPPYADDVCVVAVPSRRASVKKRGFSGGLLIARAFSRLLGVALCDPLRLRGRVAQKSLDLDARARNARASLTLRSRRSVRSQLERYTTVILLDDVFTTGATASRCAELLKECGVTRVHAITFAMET